MSFFARLIALLCLIVTSACAPHSERAPSSERTETVTLQFPDKFKWCTATSGYQVEGNNDNTNWRDWEEKGMVLQKQKSGASADHWRLMMDDIALIKNSGVKLYRMSVEWSRIEPREGQIDPGAIEHYKKFIDQLQASGIEVSITLHHFTHPRWVEEHGAWAWKGFPSAFANFAKVVSTQVAPRVKDWYTLNEPMVVMLGGYVSGELPPGKKLPMKAVYVIYKNMILAHAAAYKVMHAEATKRKQPLRVGIAQHLRLFSPYAWWSITDRMSASTADDFFNWSLPDVLTTGHLVMKIPTQINIEEDIPEARNTLDFFGVNYYAGARLSFNPFLVKTPQLVPRKGQLTDIGWEIYPQGFLPILRQVSQRYPNRAIVISENGVADAKDVLRKRFIRDHAFYLYQALQEKIPVEGYCYWALMDNFEWKEGFMARFGLYAVDFKTLERKLRPGGEYYRDLARSNALTVKVIRDGRGGMSLAEEDRF
ncbi:MAG: glycoside hydrolase family 1 protein [Bdellovibrionota bacterium]